MAIEQGQTTAFKTNLLSGLENFAVGTPYTYKIALYTANASLDATTVAYSDTDEVVGSGYTAGGNVLVVVPPVSSGATAYISFVDSVWSSASFVTRGALIYNASTGAAVAVLNFGADKTATGVFTVSFPTASASTAIIRFS